MDETIFVQVVETLQSLFENGRDEGFFETVWKSEFHEIQTGTDGHEWGDNVQL